MTCVPSILVKSPTGNLITWFKKKEKKEEEANIKPWVDTRPEQSRQRTLREISYRWSNSSVEILPHPVNTWDWTKSKDALTVLLHSHVFLRVLCLWWSMLCKKVSKVCKSNWLILKMMMWALTRCRERCYGIMGNVGSSIFRSLTFTVLSLPHSTASWRQVLYFLPTTLQLFDSFSYFADSDDYILNIHKIINNDISRSLFLFKFESPLASEMYGKVWKPIWYIKKIYENVALMK